MTAPAFVPYQWIPRKWPVFHCVRCKAEHPCPPRDEWGVWPFPLATATTERGPDGGWQTVCIGCAKETK